VQAGTRPDGRWLLDGRAECDCLTCGRLAGVYLHLASQQVFGVEFALPLEEAATKEQEDDGLLAVVLWAAFAEAAQVNHQH
jgi:hypothetical protein